MCSSVGRSKSNAECKMPNAEYATSTLDENAGLAAPGCGPLHSALSIRHSALCHRHSASSRLQVLNHCPLVLGRQRRAIKMPAVAIAWTARVVEGSRAFGIGACRDEAHAHTVEQIEPAPEAFGPRTDR